MTEEREETGKRGAGHRDLLIFRVAAERPYAYRPGWWNPGRPSGLATKDGSDSLATIRSPGDIPWYGSIERCGGMSRDGKRFPLAGGGGGGGGGVAWMILFRAGVAAGLVVQLEDSSATLATERSTFYF